MTKEKYEEVYDLLDQQVVPALLQQYTPAQIAEALVMKACYMCFNGNLPKTWQMSTEIGSLIMSALPSEK